MDRGGRSHTELDTTEWLLPTKVHLVKAIVFPVVMYGCESWTIKKAKHQGIDALSTKEFWTAVLEKTPESHLDCKEIKPVNPKGNQSWIFIGRTEAEAETETPILWPPDAKNWLIGKDPAAAAAAKSQQSCLTLYDPIDDSLSGTSIPGILQAKTLEWVAISCSNAWKWKWKWNLSVMLDSSWLHGLQPTRLFHPWDFPGMSTGEVCHCLLQKDPDAGKDWR